MDSVYDLLFELSSEDRLRILNELKRTPLKLGQLSANVGLNVQETHRNVSRLVERRLVNKDEEGLFHLTHYGGLALMWVPNYDFIAKHCEYFSAHDLTMIPNDFLYRFGDLVNCSYIDDAVLMLDSIELMIRDAEEYIWLMTDQRFLNNYPYLKEAVDRDVEIHTIEKKGWTPPPEFNERINEEVRRILNDADKKGLILSKVLEKVDVFLYLNEKKVGGLAFLSPIGHFDYIGFESSDKSFHSWCEELYQYYWVKSEIRV